MRIVVCVKPVPVTSRLDADTGRLDRGGPSAINVLDEHAVEAALRVRDANPGAEVVLLAVAGAASAESLRPGLAMGADRAVVVSGPEFVGSDLLGTSRALAAAVASLEPQLVVLGASSPDGNGAMLWAALAERLGLPVVSRAVEISVVQDRLTVSRQTESGVDVVETNLPAVLSLSGEVASPRYPSFRDIIAAKKKVVEVLGITDLTGLDPAEVGLAGSRVTVRSVVLEPPRARGVVVIDDGHAHEHLLSFLRERNLA